MVFLWNWSQILHYKYSSAPNAAQPKQTMLLCLIITGVIFYFTVSNLESSYSKIAFEYLQAFFKKNKKSEQCYDGRLPNRKINGFCSLLFLCMSHGIQLTTASFKLYSSPMKREPWTKFWNGQWLIFIFFFLMVIKIKSVQAKYAPMKYKSDLSRKRERCFRWGNTRTCRAVYSCQGYSIFMGLYIITVNN